MFLEIIALQDLQVKSQPIEVILILVPGYKVVNFKVYSRSRRPV